MVIDWRDPAVKRVLVLMLPVTLTIGLVNVNFLVDTLFASRLLDPELAPAAIDKAFRLYMLPQGVFAVAVTTVLFPTLARLAARNDTPGLRRALDGGLRQIAFLLVPAGLLVDRSRRADRPARLPARRVHLRGHGHRRPVPTGVLDRARLQRLAVDPEPQLLRGADELDSDRDRARRRGPERGVRHRLLSPRHLGHPARDVDGERRRGDRAAGDDAPADRARARAAHARRRRPRRRRRRGGGRARIRGLVRPRRGARRRSPRPGARARGRVRRGRPRLRRARPCARAARAGGVATVASPARRPLEER